jgi:hypothetical protein
VFDTPTRGVDEDGRTSGEFARDSLPAPGTDDGAGESDCRAAVGSSPGGDRPASRPARRDTGRWDAVIAGPGRPDCWPFCWSRAPRRSASARPPAVGWGAVGVSPSTSPGRPTAGPSRPRRRHRTRASPTTCPARYRPRTSTRAARGSPITTPRPTTSVAPTATRASTSKRPATAGTTSAGSRPASGSSTPSTWTRPGSTRSGRGSPRARTRATAVGSGSPSTVTTGPEPSASRRPMGGRTTPPSRRGPSRSPRGRTPSG